MQMTLNVPEAANLSETDAQLLFTMKLFEAEKLSLGKAAGLVNDHLLGCFRHPAGSLITRVIQAGGPRRYAPP